jgi:hypothetical protein
MSYDLAVWEGPMPRSDGEALIEYKKRRIGSKRSSPSLLIRQYISALLSRWPEGPGTEGPWSDEPIIGNASGDFFYFGIVPSAAAEVAKFAAQTADKQGLVCFDPQQERLLNFAHWGTG